MRHKLKVLAKVNQTNKYTGASYTTFTEQFSLHYAPVQETLNQQYSRLGTRLDNTFNVRIRQNWRVDETQTIEIKGKRYEIIQIQRGNGGTPLNYDFLTLKKIDGKAWWCIAGVVP